MKVKTNQPPDPTTSRIPNGTKFLTSPPEPRPEDKAPQAILWLGSVVDSMYRCNYYDSMDSLQRPCRDMVWGGDEDEDEGILSSMDSDDMSGMGTVDSKVIRSYSNDYDEDEEEEFALNHRDDDDVKEDVFYREVLNYIGVYKEAFTTFEKLTSHTRCHACYDDMDVRDEVENRELPEFETEDEDDEFMPLPEISAAGSRPTMISALSSPFDSRAPSPTWKESTEPDTKWHKASKLIGLKVNSRRRNVIYVEEDEIKPAQETSIEVVPDKKSKHAPAARVTPSLSPKHKAKPREKPRAKPITFDTGLNETIFDGLHSQSVDTVDLEHFIALLDGEDLDRPLSDPEAHLNILKEALEQSDYVHRKRSRHKKKEEVDSTDSRPRRLRQLVQRLQEKEVKQLRKALHRLEERERAVFKGLAKRIRKFHFQNEPKLRAMLHRLREEQMKRLCILFETFRASVVGPSKRIRS